jgi:hypothetical protein
MTQAPSTMSDHFISAMLSRRCAVSRQSFTMPPNGPRAALHTARISSSVSVRSRSASLALTSRMPLATGER